MAEALIQVPLYLRLQLALLHDEGLGLPWYAPCPDNRLLGAYFYSAWYLEGAQHLLVLPPRQGDLQGSITLTLTQVRTGLCLASTRQSMVTSR